MCFIYNVRFDVFLKRLSHLPFFFVKDTERCPDNRKKSYRRVVLCSHLTSLGCWRIPRPSSSGPSNWDLKQKAEMATADRWPSQDGPLLSSQVLSLPRALITTNELAFTVNKPATSEMLGRQSVRTRQMTSFYGESRETQYLYVFLGMWNCYITIGMRGVCYPYMTA